jgi:flagellar protein FlbD
MSQVAVTDAPLGSLHGWISQMIVVTRRNGTRFALNPDLVERIEQTPDTVITLIGGVKYVVEESVEQLIDEIRAYRASVLIAAERHIQEPAAPALASLAPLTLVPGAER